MYNTNKGEVNMKCDCDPNDVRNKLKWKRRNSLIQKSKERERTFQESNKEYNAKRMLKYCYLGDE